MLLETEVLSAKLETDHWAKYLISITTQHST